MTQRVCMYLVKNNVIKEADIEIYSYGLNQMFVMGFNLLTTFILGILFDMLLETFVFMAVYVPIRTYAGGLHMSTQVRCYFASVVMIVLALFVIGSIDNNYMLCLLLSVTSGIIILKLAPVQDSNKPLSEGEKISYGKRTKSFVIVAIMATFAGIFIGRPELYTPMSVGILFLAVMLVLGYIKNKCIQNQQS